MGIPGTCNNRYISEEIRAAEALQPPNRLGVLLGEPGSNTSNDEKNTSDLNESTNGRDAAHDIHEIDNVVAVGVSETSRVDEQVLLVIDNRGADVVLPRT